MSVQFGFEHTYAERLEGTYLAWDPPGFPNPELLLFNVELAQALGVPPVVRDQAAQLLSGSTVPADARPIAQAYAGHQFGGFSPQLGDGRALLLGEIVDAEGDRWDIQLKGSGQTPFSRGGDGKATVGPILREALVSEAMYVLGAPTSRVLAAARTGEQVRRERMLPGAVLARTAASHLRVGTLQFFAARGEHEALSRIVDYALERHYPDRVGGERPAVELLEGVIEAQAELIAAWMSLGFVHGVMNTDNFTLSGETIDYGPCAFMDGYDPKTVFSSIDRQGRYAYGNQPGIGLWNLTRMAEALLSLLADDEAAAIAVAEERLGRYPQAYQAAFIRRMREKLGLRGAEPDDATLVDDLLAWMQPERRDFTSTFRGLGESLEAPLACDPTFGAWHARWRARHGDEPDAAIAERMRACNPVYIPRNHRVEEALDAAIEGEMGPFEALRDAVLRPFEARPGLERYAEPAPDTFGPYRTFCGT